MRRELVRIRSELDAIDENAIQHLHKQDLRRMEEFNGSDVHFRYTIAATLPGNDMRYPDIERTFDVWVEIKPYLSDDYPAALRQVDIQRKLAADKKVEECRFVVVVGQYGGHGASLEQVRQIFSESGFDLVLLEEIGCEFPKAAPASPSDHSLPLFSN